MSVVWSAVGDGACLSCVQLSVTARDAGVPNSRPSSNRATVIVTVIRNEKTPIFFKKSYTATLKQDVPVGTDVVTVAASDKDSAVSGQLAGGGTSTPNILFEDKNSLNLVMILSLLHCAQTVTMSTECDSI